MGTGSRHGFRGVLFRTLDLTTSLLFVGIGLEISIRVFSPQPIVPRYVEIGPLGIRKNIPHVRGEMITAEYRHRFSTNSQGFRGKREYSRLKRSGTYRIVVLGDSVALVHGVADEQTFSAVLERELSRVRPCEVINMGVSGFGTAEELIQLRGIGLDHDPDLVVLAYFPNDPFNNVVSDLFRLERGQLVRNEKAFSPVQAIRDRLYRIPGYSFLSQHSHLVNFARIRVSRHFQMKLAREKRVSVFDQTNASEDASRLTGALLNEIASDTGRAGIPLIIVDIPVVTHTGEAVRNLPVDRIRMPTAVHLMDTVEACFEGRPPSAWSYRADCHPTVLGHELIAKCLGSLIRGRLWTGTSRRAGPP